MNNTATMMTGATISGGTRVPIFLPDSTGRREIISAAITSV